MDNPHWRQQPTLADRHVSLEPLQASHADALVRAATDLDQEWPVIRTHLDAGLARSTVP